MADRPLFTGSAEHGLDDKGRLVVPARFRERLGGGFFITISEGDACLALYPAATWAEFCAVLMARPVKDEAYRKFVRTKFSHTDEVNVDAQGRLVIAPHLRAWAGIERDVVSVGALTRVELWAKERYDRQAAESGQLPDFAAELGLL
jgi:MraZ protein